MVQEESIQKFSNVKTNLQAWEQALRHALTNSALRYLGTQYRWAGKSSQGVDCSGLLFLSYMENLSRRKNDRWISDVPDWSR